MRSLALIALTLGLTMSLSARADLFFEYSANHDNETTDIMDKWLEIYRNTGPQAFRFQLQVENEDCSPENGVGVIVEILDRNGATDRRLTLPGMVSILLTIEVPPRGKIRARYRTDGYVGRSGPFGACTSSIPTVKYQLSEGTPVN